MKATPAQASNEEEAIKVAISAAYKQSGMEDNVNKLAERIVPEKVKKIAEHVGPLAEVIINKRVNLEWTF